MQTCSYCGRENEDGAPNCRECGTELDQNDRKPPPVHAAEKSPGLNLEDVDGAFTTHDGFSRPSWSTILKAMRCCHSPEERLAAWTDVVSQWGSRWEAELGPDYWMTASGSFFLVSDLDGDAAERILQSANSLAQKVRNILAPIAWEDRPLILIVHVTNEVLAGRFEEAVSGRPEDDIQKMPAELSPCWILVCSQDETATVQDIESSLVWNCLSHLPLPRWLHGGVSTELRRIIAGTRNMPLPQVFDADRIPEHRRFWNATTIQSFWAGTVEAEYPNQSHLFYELSNILVHLLTEKTKSLVDYLRCAHPYDAGQSAALVCLRTDLGELAGTFLGPGHWTPEALAILECWEHAQQINSEDGAG